MAAINSIVVRDAAAVANELVKRKNWPAKNVGVMVVFCIVGVVAIFLIGLFIYKQLQKRKASKSEF